MNSQGNRLQRIISGGQTGVDRAALDAAIALGIEHGGWCPRGRLAEDGPIDPKYSLRETDEAEYAVRTEKNVVDSDGTLVLHRGEIVGGTRQTVAFALQHAKPLLSIDFDSAASEAEHAQRLADWIRAQNIRTLNIAGPRESTAPGIASTTRQFIVSALSRLSGAELTKE